MFSFVIVIFAIYIYLTLLDSLVNRGRSQDPNKADLGGDRPMDMASDEAMKLWLNRLNHTLNTVTPPRKLK